MSLIDALLQDPVPMEQWIALRTDGAIGSGSENDPWNGGRAGYPVLSVTAVLVSQAGANYTVQIDTSTPHGFSSVDVVLMSGFSGRDGELLNGFFKPTPVNSTQFTYTVLYNDLSQYPAPATPSSIVGVTCQKDPLLFDAVMTMLKKSGQPVRVNLGPGVFETKGYQYYYRDYLNKVSWMPWAGLVIRGSGMKVTTLKLVGGSYRNIHYHAIGMPSLGYEAEVADGFTAEDFTIDCNVAGQFSSQLTCGAINLRGSHTVLRRLRAINFGRQGPAKRVQVSGGSATQVHVTPELFVFSIGGSSWMNKGGKYQSTDCVIEDCIVEQPGFNSARESTMMIVSGSDVDEVNRMPVLSEATVFRRNYIDCEYQNNPHRITLVTPAQVGGFTKVTVTTATPHGLATNDWARVSGVKVAATTDPETHYVNNLDGYSNPYNGAFQVTKVNDTQFYYNTTASAPSVDSYAGAWINRWPSDVVKVASVSAPSSIGNGIYEVQVTTMQPHYLVPKGSSELDEGPYPPGCIASLDFTKPDDVPDNLNVPWFVTAVSDNFHFTCRRNFEGRTPTTATGFKDARIGARWQGMTGARLIESNQVRSMAIAGQYVDSFGLAGTVVRGNLYSGVRQGMFITLEADAGPLNQTGLPTVKFISNRSSGGIFYATFEMAPPSGPAQPHYLSLGQGILLTGVKNGSTTLALFNRSFKVLAIPTPAQFEIQLDEEPELYPDSANRPTMDWLWVNSDCVVEDNIIEILPGLPDSYGAGFTGGIEAGGLTLVGQVKQSTWDNNSWTPKNSPRDFRRHLRLAVRGNTIRYALNPLGKRMTGFPQVESAINLQSVEGGVIAGNRPDVSWRPSYTHVTPLINKNNDPIYYFNNVSSGGRLVPGTMGESAGVGGSWVSPVNDAVEAALVMALL